MKKLLSLLSILTISGTAVPTTIAASPYQKEKNNQTNNNHLNINNSRETTKIDLIRNKRDNNNNFKIYSEEIIIDENDKNKYNESINELINYLVDRNIIESIFESENRAIYMINNNYNNNDYIIIPVSIIGDNEESKRKIELVIRLSNFYLVGFIVNTVTFQGNNIRNYYYFTENNDTDLTHIDNTIAADFSLNYNGNYNTLINTSDFSLSWNNIFNSFINLSRLSGRDQNRMNKLKEFLARIIITISESIRFRSIFNLISNEIETYNGELDWNNDISDIVTNWQSRSKDVINSINNVRSNIGDRTWFLLSTLPFDFNRFIQDFEFIGIRIVLGLILQPDLNCKRKPRNIDINDNIKNEYCYAIRGSRDNKYPLENKKINLIKILNEEDKGNLKAGDVYVGTEEGLYLIRENGIVLKVDNIDIDENDHTAITSIKDFGNGNFFVSTNNEEVYFLNTKPVNNGHIIGERFWNAESSNLEKELRIYYNSEKSDVSFQTNYKLSDTDNKYGKIQPSINLGKISPIENYKKIDFLGNNLNTYMSWGNDGYKGTSIKDYVKNENLDDLIINKKIINNNEAIVNSNKSLQSQCDKDFIAGMCVNQNFGLTFYWENNYFLQIIAKQYIRLWSSYSGGTMLIDIGNGIRLYNDDYDDDKDNYAYFSLDKKNNLQLLIKYAQILYSEFIRYNNYYLSKFSKYFEYSTIKKFYSFLENFLTKCKL